MSVSWCSSSVLCRWPAVSFRTASLGKAVLPLELIRKEAGSNALCLLSTLFKAAVCELCSMYAYPSGTRLLERRPAPPCSQLSEVLCSQTDSNNEERWAYHLLQRSAARVRLHARHSQTPSSRAVTASAGTYNSAAHIFRLPIKRTEEGREKPLLLA